MVVSQARGNRFGHGDACIVRRSIEFLEDDKYVCGRAEGCD